MLDWTHFVAIIGVGLAALMAYLWRGAEVRLVTRNRELEAKRAELKTAESALDKEQKARRRQSEELTEFRRRADKSKRRGSKPAAQPMGTASRIQDLEQVVEKTARERDRIRIERDGLTQELAQLRARVELDARAAAAAATTAAAANAMPIEPTPDIPDPRLALEAGLAQAQERITKLESEQQVVRQTEARLRKRLDTQEQLYASVRAELEAKKDRLRTQEEQLQRLQALKVAMID